MRSFKYATTPVMVFFRLTLTASQEETESFLGRSLKCRPRKLELCSLGYSFRATGLGTRRGYPPGSS